MAILQAMTEGGMVEGLPGWNQAVTLFRGIPYAAPPVGELRWKAPQPVESREGVRKAEEFTAPPVQGVHRKGSFYDREWQNEPFTSS